MSKNLQLSIDILVKRVKYNKTMNEQMIRVFIVRILGLILDDLDFKNL